MNENHLPIKKTISQKTIDQKTIGRKPSTKKPLAENHGIKTLTQNPPSILQRI
jgi:hypothetical protein